MYLERVQKEVPEFNILVSKLTKNFSIQGKSSSTLRNYTRYLVHLTLHYNASPTIEVFSFCFYSKV